MGPSERMLMMRVIDLARNLETSGPRPEQLGSLQEAIANLDAFWEGSFMQDGFADAPPKDCDKCGAVFFFAKDINGRWKPMEYGPVPAAGVLPSDRYVVSFLRGANGNPEVRTDPNATGDVWILHSKVCGANEGPRKKVAPYYRRWQYNVQLFRQRSDESVGELLSLQRQLARMQARGGPVVGSYDPDADTET